jgi:spore coat protein SA
MIYQLLPEWETFSAYHGGAVAKNIANMMRFDKSRIVVCKAGDDTWGFGADRILVIPELQAFRTLRGRRWLPTWITGTFLRHIFEPLLSRLVSNDVVWCHSQPAYCAALEKSIHAKGAKLIYHAHSSLTSYAEVSKFRSFTPDAVIFVSEAMRLEALQKLPDLQNTHSIYNGADETLFYPVPAEEIEHRAVPTILYVGRLHPEKGTHVLMDAMRTLQERRVDAICRVVGSSFSGGSKPNSYVKSLTRNQPSNVKFADYCSCTKIANEYRAADILCCPSIYEEPFGNVNIEAMACGVPVVASRVGGIPEIAAEGGVILVTPGSEIELADALQKLIENRHLRETVGTDGLKSFRSRFTWRKIVEQYQEVIASL